MRRLVTVLLVGMLLVLSGCGIAANSDITVKELRCEYRVNPLGIDVAEPQLSWILQSNQRGQKQNAYQILVANSKEKLAADDGNLWGSGKVESNQSIHVPYEGKPLKSRMRCYWKVRVWDKNDRASGWSKPAMWSMGLMNTSDWQGKWIGARVEATPPMSKKESIQKWDLVKARLKSGLNMVEDDQYRAENAAILMRKEVKVKNKPLRATAHICGLGYYELYINGKKVGDHVLDPGWTDYTKRVLYVTYDVTEHLKQECNAIGVILGNGWYSVTQPDEWWMEKAPWIAPPKLLLNIELEFADGMKQTIVTDNTWKWSTGPIVHNCIRGGEAYDARKEKPGWDKCNYNDPDWKPVKVVPAPAGRLVAQQHPPIRVVQSIRPVKLTEPKPGVYVFDLGVNIAGWVRFKTSGKCGQKVTFQFNEMLNEDGTVNMVHCSQYTFGRFQTGELILKGQGVEVYEPRFTYHGFRYVQVTGLTKKPTLDSLTGCWVHTDIEPVGEFSCSNEKLNKIQQVILRSQLNYVHHHPADPLREKLGWMQDAQTCTEMGILNFDMARLYRKWFRDMLDSQDSNGNMPLIAPTSGWSKSNPNGSPGPYCDPWWSGAVVYLPWRLYQYYGDIRILEEGYEGMKKFVDYLDARAQDNLVSWHLGDWCAVGFHGPPSHTPVTQTTTCGYFYCAKLVSKTASLLGRHDDAKKYGQLAENIKASFNRNFFDAATGLYARDSQTAQILPLELGMVAEDKKDIVLKRLIENIAKCQNHLNTGFVGTLPLMRGLTEFGYADLAYTIAAQEDYPGWWYMIKDGGTTIWEDWEGPDSPSSIISRNIVSLGGPVGFWFYQALGGIRPDPSGPGFKKIIIKPEVVGDLTWAKAGHKSIHGKIATHWKLEDDVLKLDVTIPANTTATVYVPATNAGNVTESGRRAAKAPHSCLRPPPRLASGDAGAGQEDVGVKFLRMDNDRAVFAVGSGRYRFVSKLSQ